MAGSSSSINTSSFKSASIEKNLADFCGKNILHTKFASSINVTWFLILMCVSRASLECVKNLKLNFEDTGIPIDDDNIEFHRMCQKLEFLLNAGLKGNHLTKCCY